MTSEPEPASESEFEAAVRWWHESDSREPLHVWLGLSWEEYARLVESPSGSRCTPQRGP